MVDAWPAEFPQELEQNGFSEGVGDGVLEYQPDQGPSISRRRTSAVMRPLSGTMQMSAAQIATLRTFFDTTLMGGALPFEFPDQIQDGTLLVKFPKGAGPSWSALSGELYRVQLSMMVLP
ncbi:hypothetical protein [Tardiphaga sp. 839_C3_N1_4]|uniref:hypothetical protein n=1 Tax=Tardiphaga sp. 839_C3_N1_4 TaxID=3240761 RepID=UPI003F1EEB39